MSSLLPKTLTILDDLKKQGHRLTETRKQFINFLVKEDKPLSAQQIIQELKSKRKSVNKTTIYREIIFLKQAHIIHEIDLLEGQKRYEIYDPNSHHHHLVCTKCNAIACIEMPNDLEALESKIENKHQFKISGHILEFFGLCQSCNS